MKTLTDAEFRRLLDQCSDTDFDGHSEFTRMTPEQRLQWLSQVVQFYVENAGAVQRGTRSPNPPLSDTREPFPG